MFASGVLHPDGLELLFREAIRTDGGLDETRKAREMGAFSVGTPTVFAGVSRNRDLDNAALSLEVGTAKRLSGNPLLPIAPAIHRSQSSCQFTKRDHEAVVEQRS